MRTTRQNRSFDPSAVRVWWGHKQPGLATEDFLNTLGGLFIPVTVQQMQPLGLVSYLPAVLPEEKPAGVPDEVAIVFYESGEAYQASKNTVFGREYQMLHRAVFSFDSPLASKSTFPASLSSELDTKQPYQLFAGTSADWQSGTTKFICGVPRIGQSASQFVSELSAALKEIQSHPRPGLDGAIVWASDSFFTYWEHYTEQGATDTTNLDQLAQLVTTVQRSESAQPVSVPLHGNADYAGITVSSGTLLNFQFPRRSGAGQVTHS